MNFLLYTTTYGRSGSIQLSRPAFWVPAVLVLSALIGAVGTLGYYLGGSEVSVARQPGGEGAHWLFALNEQKQDLAQVRDEAQNHLNALAVRMGQMQAQMLRLEALGQRVAQKSKLDEFEFDFDQLPAQGGPADTADTEPLGSLNIMKALDELALQIDDRQRQMEVLEQVVSQRELKQAVSPAGRPIGEGWLSSYYGKRTDPFSGRQEMHKGMDFAGKMGSDVLATAAGVVTWAGKRYGYGQLVEINHGNDLVTRYGHAQETLVKVGDIVEPGRKIALMGSSGRSTGPHVHYEVLKNGKQINPTKYVRASRASR
jgi:murein DD-endopeptidase MepM/ murein hydrolase activator NlpD